MTRLLLAALVAAAALAGLPAYTGGAVPELVEVAEAHGPHHSPIRPAYDCFRYWNTETRRWHSTEGDYSITNDLDLDVYILWRCTCVWSVHYQRYFCHWREVARARDISALPKPEDRKPGDQYQVRKREYVYVKWMAYHAATGGCVVHTGRRWVSFIRLHGSEG